MEDGFHFRGLVTIRINDKIVQVIKNLVVDSGIEFIISRLKDSSADTMSHMAVGTGIAAPAGADTALGTEAGRVTLASSVTDGSKITYVASFPAGTATGALTEAGIFSASSGGTMLCRTVFAVVNKSQADPMSITWQVNANVERVSG